MRGVSYRFGGGWRQRELRVAIEAAERPGQRLLARFDPFALTGTEPNDDFVSKEHVRWAVVEGLRRGWKPHERGPAFELRAEHLYGEHPPSRWSDEREYRALLDAILASPDEPGPRQVLADWLLDRGDLRGQLIRQQDPALLRRFWRRWSAPVWKLARRWSFRGGFLEEMAGCRLGERDPWLELHRLEPVRKVHVALCPGQGEALSWLLQPTHREVTIEGPLGPDEVRFLRLHPQGKLERLYLIGLTDAGVAELGRENWQSLPEMELRGANFVPLNGYCAEALLDSPHPPQHVHLHALHDPMAARFTHRRWRFTSPGQW